MIFIKNLSFIASSNINNFNNNFNNNLDNNFNITFKYSNNDIVAKLIKNSYSNYSTSKSL